jgi:hypothetical protein
MKEVKIGRQLTALDHPRALSRKSFCRAPDESAFKRRRGSGAPELRGSEVALQVHRRSSGRENVSQIKIVG